MSKIIIDFIKTFHHLSKIATQVLHDGDLVEVDADNGVVRILEKSN